MIQKSPKIVVVGSFNMDLVIKADRRPKSGETLIGNEFAMFIGGKGSNQAIAAARLGAEVTMVGRLGTDPFGDRFMAEFAKENIDTRYVVRDATLGTGVASPVIDADGENSIIIVPQANMALSPEDVNRASSRIAEADVLLLQMEVPIESSQCAAQLAQTNGAQVILNPAPAGPLHDEFLAQVDVLTPNELETEFLSGVTVTDEEGARRAANVLLDKGISTIVLTLGSRGSLLSTNNQQKLIKGYEIDVVDTTGAGDAFCGALATALGRGAKIEEAVTFANAAGALAVTVLGAAPSLPTSEEIDKFLVTAH